MRPSTNPPLTNLLSRVRMLVNVLLGTDKT
jgi:hypothetical protein